MQPGDITFAHLFSGDVAVVGAERTSGDRLFLMVNGRAWRDITPPATGNPLMVDDAFFLDNQHGWATTYDPGRALVQVWRTSNAGSSWQTGTGEIGRSMGAGSEALLSFVNSTVGWMTVLQPTGPVGQLWETTDAGRSWKTVGDRLPELGQVRFADSAEGWLWDVYGCDAYATHDGGMTWTRQNPPFPEGEGHSAANGFGPLFVLGPGHALMGVEAVSANTEFVVVYETTDAGANWAIRSSPPAFGGDYMDISSCDRTSRISLADRSNWWALNRDLSGWVIHRTADAGRTWSSVAPHGLPPLANSALVEATLEAADSLHAAVTIVSGARRQLFMTSDGGSNWSQFIPPSG